MRKSDLTKLEEILIQGEQKKWEIIERLNSNFERLNRLHEDAISYLKKRDKYFEESLNEFKILTKMYATLNRNLLSTFRWILVVLIISLISLVVHRKVLEILPMM